MHSYEKKKTPIKQNHTFSFEVYIILSHFLNNRLNYFLVISTSETLKC